MPAPLITILMPIHNGAATLKEAMDSMLGQSLADFEFLIVDDASTDESAAIVQKCRDPRIRFIPSRERLKLSGALNLGLEQARGRYIARMDADDISLPRRLEIQARFMDQNPGIGLCGSWIRYFGAKNSVLERPLHHEDIRAFTLIDTPFAHPTVMFRRDVMEQHQLRFDGSYFPTEDFELWTRALRHFATANLPEVLLRYRAHGSSLTGSDWSTMDEQAVRVIRSQLLPLGIDPTPEALRFHRQLAMGRLNMSLPLLDQAEAWLLSLLEANRKTRHLSPEALEALLGEVWGRAALHTAKLGFEAARRYSASPLSSLDARRTRHQWLIRLAALKAKFT
jgi:hypothetical protein